MSTSDGSYAAALDGRVSGAGRRVAVVVARFNARITDFLLEGAVSCLVEHGVDRESVEIYRVPGAWELPQAVARLARPELCDAIVALGCVIRGETAHFDLIATEVSRGLASVARTGGTPVAFGVLTTETEEQALERADPSRGNKGREAALAALEMAELYRRLAPP